MLQDEVNVTNIERRVDEKRGPREPKKPRQPEKPKEQCICEMCTCG